MATTTKHQDKLACSPCNGSGRIATHVTRDSWYAPGEAVATAPCRHCRGTGDAACTFCDAYAPATGFVDGDPACDGCRVEYDAADGQCRCGSADVVGVDQHGPACERCLSTRDHSHEDVFAALMGVA